MQFRSTQQRNEIHWHWRMTLSRVFFFLCMPNRGARIAFVEIPLHACSCKKVIPPWVIETSSYAFSALMHLHTNKSSWSFCRVSNWRGTSLSKTPGSRGSIYKQLSDREQEVLLVGYEHELHNARSFPGLESFMKRVARQRCQLRGPRWWLCGAVCALCTHLA